MSTLARRTRPLCGFFCVIIVLVGSGRSGAQVGGPLYNGGLIFASKARFQALPVAHIARALRPPEVDLSSLAPPVGNQGSQNSCVGWAVAYAARTIIANKAGNDQSGPFSPAYIYNRGRTLEAAGNPANPGQDCNVGMQIETALGLLQGFGVLPLRAFPYSDTQCFRLPTVAEDYSAKKYIISGWARATAREDVLQSIAAKIPVIIGIRMYETFKEYRGGVYKNIRGNYIGPHALVILGYSEKKHAYKIVNSWGASQWGDGGFAWIDYDTLDQMATVDGLYRAYIIYPMNHG